MNFKLICLILLGAFCTAAWAQDFSARSRIKNNPVRPKTLQTTNKKDGGFNRFIFNFGTHTEFFNNIQSDSSGGVRRFDLAPTVGLGLMSSEDQSFGFMPEINWVLPQNGGDSRIIKNILMLRADFGHLPVDWFRLRLGTSLIWLNQHGRGGSTQINNGNTVSTFYYPEENRSSFNNTLDLGAELLLDSWALRLQTYTYAFFREERRQVSYTLFVSYYWDR